MTRARVHATVFCTADVNRIQKRVTETKCCYADQFREATDDLQKATEFLKTTHASELDGYAGDSIHFIIETLKHKHAATEARLVSDDFTVTRLQLSDSGRDAGVRRLAGDSTERDRHKTSTAVATTSNELSRKWHGVNDDDDNGGGGAGAGAGSGNSGRRGRRLPAVRQVSAPPNYGNRRETVVQRWPRSTERSRKARHVNQRQSSKDQDVEIISLDDDDDDNNDDDDDGHISQPAKDVAYSTVPLNGTATNATDDASQSDRDTSSPPLSIDENGSGYTYAQNLLKIAHLLHYVGIGILAFFVIQVGGVTEILRWRK